MAKKCEKCGKFIDEKATWSAGYHCDYYCSKKCCNRVYEDQFISLDKPFDGNYPTCPCY